MGVFFYTPGRCFLLLETNQLYNMDCLEGMKLIEDKSIDMILCDLPYGTTKCKWDTVIPFEALWRQYERVIKDNGVIILFGSQPFTTDLINSNRKLFRYTLVWDKKFAGNFANAKRMPMKTHEDICVFYKKLPTYNPQMIKREKPIKTTTGTTSSRSTNFGLNNQFHDIERSYDLKYPISIIEYKRKLGQKVFHPTEKPVELFEYLIKTYSNEGELVLDNCMGSGTTAIAALNSNRKFIGFELEKSYYELSQNRIKEALNKASFFMSHL